MGYIKYELHVSAIILAIIRLYSTYQVAVQYVWYTGLVKIMLTLKL